MRLIGTSAYGIRLPILKEGDDLVSIVADYVLKTAKHHQLTLHDHDIVSVTEALVARTQGNYATIDDIANDIKAKFSTGTVGVVFPILSRNRFSIVLKGIAKGCKKVIVQLSYPNDEVGNQFISEQDLIDHHVNPYTDSFTEAAFRETFGYQTKHRFTHLDYIEYYKSLSDNIEVVFSNDPCYILNYTNQVLAADIHSRHLTKAKLKQYQDAVVYGLDDILSHSINGSGYNAEYGLLGSNKATETTVKLFPNHCQQFVQAVQEKLKSLTGKLIEVVVYGDGAFKDPVGHIWELADPVSALAYTDGLKGTPNELKIKFLADNAFKNLTGDDLQQALIDSIHQKDNRQLVEESEGTTPRQIADLVCSLSDLVSGSGDKGTPVILIQGYFDNYASQ